MTYYLCRSASHLQVRPPLTKFHMENIIILKPYLEPVPETLLVLKDYLTALMERIFLGRSSRIIIASDMSWCLSISPWPVMVVVRGSRLSTPYHAQWFALFWSGMMTLQRSGEPLEPGNCFLGLLPRNRKLTVRQYRGRVPGPECGRTLKYPKAVRSLSDQPKGVVVVKGQWTERFY